jgi:Zinc dependent phospholipase C
MPGPYAHITLLYELLRPGRLESIFTRLSGLDVDLETYFPYCALGAVSPDFPNLAKWDDSASQWADAMHCTRACKMIASGVRRIRDSEGADRGKMLAWLLGYCSHVVADVTIHPFVQAKVGVYSENQRQHRICEMNQDSHIYRRMNLGEIGESDVFAQTVAQSSSSNDKTLLDRDIVTLWEGMLNDVYPELFVGHPPDITSWHRYFVAKVTEHTNNSVRLFPLASVIASKMGEGYPTFDRVDRQFIEEQFVESDRPLYLHYDEIFDAAASNVTVMWRQLERAVVADAADLMTMFGDWNLDTGRDENDRLVFW